MACEQRVFSMGWYQGRQRFESSRPSQLKLLINLPLFWHLILNGILLLILNGYRRFVLAILDLFVRKQMRVTLARRR